MLPLKSNKRMRMLSHAKPFTLVFFVVGLPACTSIRFQVASAQKEKLKVMNESEGGNQGCVSIGRKGIRHEARVKAGSP